MASLIPKITLGIEICTFYTLSPLIPFLNDSKSNLWHSNVPSSDAESKAEFYIFKANFLTTP